MFLRLFLQNSGGQDFHFFKHSFRDLALDYSITVCESSCQNVLSGKSLDPSPEVTVVGMHLLRMSFLFFYFFIFMENPVGVVLSFWHIGAYGLTARVFRGDPDYF